MTGNLGKECHSRQRRGRRADAAATAAWPSPRLVLLALALPLVAGCETVEVDVAMLADLPVPAEHQQGAALFDTWCQACHGPHAAGSEIGPALVHTIYRPRHHGDEAFQIAVAQGVRAHHFRFGDMPAVPGLSRDEVTAITGYVRWLQRAAGID